MRTERLEIRIDPDEARWLGAEARRRGVSVGALVREAIRRFREATEAETATRLAAVDRLARLEAPVADWETMKREIEIAYLDPEIRAALAARLGVEPEACFEALRQLEASRWEELLEEVFQDLSVRGRVPSPSEWYREPFVTYVHARLREGKP